VSAGSHFDLRNSRRFPLQLQVTLKTATEEYRAKTIDISAGGILFHTEAAIQEDSPVWLTIGTLGEALGAERPVLLKCQGRLVRCCEDAPGWNVAVVIDEYALEWL
jgi:hypothetical protein